MRSAFIASILLLPASASATLTVTDIGTIGRGAIFGNDLSEDGRVAGVIDTDTDVRGFFWSSATGIVDPFDGNHPSNYETSSVVQGSTRAGFYRFNNGVPINGVVFGTEPGTFTELQKIGPTNGSATPNGGNANGQIVGTGQIQSGPSLRNRAVLWDAQGNATNLGTLGGVVSAAVGINNAGVVIGSSRNATNNRAFRWTATDGMQELPTITAQSTEDSAAFAINSSGAIVGNSNLITDDGGVITSSFMGSWLYTGGNSVTPLGEFVANDINDSGIIVGSAIITQGTSDVVQHGFVRLDGVWTDLNSLIDPALNLTITNASDINNAGQILAAATSSDPDDYAFHTVIVQVPEPAMMSLLMPVAAALAVRRRKRQS